MFSGAISYARSGLATVTGFVNAHRIATGLTTLGFTAGVLHLTRERRKELKKPITENHVWANLTGKMYNFYEKQPTTSLVGRGLGDSSIADTAISNPYRKEFIELVLTTRAKKEAKPYLKVWTSVLNVSDVGYVQRRSILDLEALDKQIFEKSDRMNPAEIAGIRSDARDKWNPSFRSVKDKLVSVDADGLRARLAKVNVLDTPHLLYGAYKFKLPELQKVLDVAQGKTFIGSDLTTIRKPENMQKLKEATEGLAALQKQPEEQQSES